MELEEFEVSLIMIFEMTRGLGLDLLVSYSLVLAFLRIYFRLYKPFKALHWNKYENFFVMTFISWVKRKMFVKVKKIG